LAVSRSPVGGHRGGERVRFAALTQRHLGTLQSMLAADLSYGRANGCREQQAQLRDTIRRGRLSNRVVRIRSQQAPRSSMAQSRWMDGAMDGEVVTMQMLYRAAQQQRAAHSRRAAGCARAA